MKKLLLLSAIAFGLLFFTSCEKESKSFPVGTWRTTNQYYSLVLGATESDKELLKELGWAEEMEISLDVSEAERFEMTFKENGTGSGSGLRYEEEGRHRFSFMWKFSEGDIIFYNRNSSLGNEYIDHFHWRPLSYDNWEIEEYSANKMVLVWQQDAIVDNFDAKEGEPLGWMEFYTYRYTFERVK